MPFEIREASRPDARAIAEVHVEGWAWGYRGLLPDEVIAARTVGDREAQWIEAFTDRSRQRDACFVAEADDGRVLGFVACGPAADEQVPPPADAGEVYAIYLREAAKDRGVGGALMAAAEDAMRASGFDHAILWVLEANVRARSFYEGGGWTWDGTVGEHRFECDARPILRYVREL